MIKFHNKYLDKEFIASFNSRDKGSLTEIGKNIFHGKILNEIFCDLVLNKVKLYEFCEDQKLNKQPNSMHSNAISLQNLGLDEFVNDFFKKILVNVIRLIFPEQINQEFDGIHGFVVRYGNTRDKHLDFHVDDSLITMNLCLNGTFSGSDLIFNGVRCPIHIDTPFQDKEEITITHQKGFTVMHEGKNRHYVNSITDGNRYGLIIWCQNFKERSDWFDSLENYQCTDFCDYEK
jgi:hypothetical protein